MSRKDARERAFQLLYQLSIQEDDVEQQIGEFFNHMDDYHDEDRQVHYSEEDLAYIQEIASTFRFKLEDVDASFTPYLKDWTKERLPKVDLAILRIAAIEILFKQDVPLNVSINEAVLLAKRFSAPESRSYINGILAKLEKPKEEDLVKEDLADEGVDLDEEELVEETIHLIEEEELNG